MIVQQTLGKLEAIGLGAMAAGLREQLENPAQYLELSFEDRLGLLVDRETDWRESRRLASRLKAAKLRHSAAVEGIDFRAPRGLDRAVILSLAQAGWVQNHQNLILTGATGCGKSFLACALAHAAIRQGHTALYLRAPRLLEDLALSRGDGRYARLLGQLQRVALLVLDDFLLSPAPVEQCRDLPGGHRQPDPAPLHPDRQPAAGRRLARRHGRPHPGRGHPGSPPSPSPSHHRQGSLHA